MGLKSRRQGADGARPACRSCPAITATTRTRRSLQREADAHRLSGADQGERRRRRQGHAHRRERRGLRRRARLVPARGRRQLRRRRACCVERYVTRPRHIEIQVFADAHGNCVYLFERDCSVQRRHQKVLEEAPAPGLQPGAPRARWARPRSPRRARSATSAPARSSSSPSRPRRRFYFMEMNTRLQVEHPVTEAITGLDLVEWQLRVAAGEPLPLTQDELRIDGHAIEARICAEDPDAGLPAGDRRARRLPDARPVELTRGPVRIDAGVREGDAISPHYDPMIAKLIVWGDDRAQALARLTRALAATHIVGVHTNVAFLRRVVASPSFARRRPRHRADRARARAPVRAAAAAARGRGGRRRRACAGRRARARGRRPVVAARWLAPARQRAAPLRHRCRRARITCSRSSAGATARRCWCSARERWPFARDARAATACTTSTLGEPPPDADGLRRPASRSACSRPTARRWSTRSTRSRMPAKAPSKAAASPRRCPAR